MDVQSFSDILDHQVRAVDSRLCVGLDLDANRVSSGGSTSFENLRDFGRMVIDATLKFAAAFKLNFAFFERHGSAGFRWLEDILSQIDGRRLTIGDGKWGDISNSAEHYASAIFDKFGFDAATVNPYMGRDAIIPFLERSEKGAFVLCLTSNDSASDLQYQKVGNARLYGRVVSLTRELNVNNNCGLVVGATREAELGYVRERAGNMPFLIPGVGAQGGNLEASVRIGNRGGVALISVSRSILYAGDQSEEAIRKAAKEYSHRINASLEHGNSPSGS
ncbi:MAG: orotidine-5'-phosphate decarboxylase [Candidatus Neomarinimicrobiota bacterium]